MNEKANPYSGISRPIWKIRLVWIRSCSDSRRLVQPMLQKIHTNLTQWALPRTQNWPAQKAVPRRARERMNGGNWETEEMKWFTELATERISRMLKSLTSLMSLRTLKSKQQGCSGQHSWRSPFQSCLTAQWCGWDHPASQSTQDVGLLRGLHKDKSNKDVWGRLAKHSPDDRTITQLLSSQLLTQGSADSPGVVQVVWGSRHIFKADMSVFQQLTA